MFSLPIHNAENDEEKNALEQNFASKQLTKFAKVNQYLKVAAKNCPEGVLIIFKH